jgi:hypothetical protein
MKSGQWKMTQTILDPLIEQMAALFSALPQVQAVGMAGSRVNPSTPFDPASDIDLYVFTTADIPLETRQGIVEKTGGTSRAELGLNYWGPNDTWFHLPSGVEIDNNFIAAIWMEEQIDRVLVHHEASLGYSTCFWHTMKNMIVLADPNGWLKNLKERCAAEYPEPLRRNIIRFNHPVLRTIIPAYAHQLEKAVLRGDMVSVNHRLSGLLASYFDILFALNHQTHPGEKRLLELATAACPLLPEDMNADVRGVLLTAADNLEHLGDCVNQLLDHLDELLRSEGFLE